MIKILIVSFYYTQKSPGGAAKSFLNITENLKSIKELELEFLNLKDIKKSLNPLGISHYFYFFNVLRRVNRFKPHIILTQTSAAFGSILASRVKKTPIINIIRDSHLICPKHNDIIEYGVSCKGLIDRNTCYNCINYWRTLRVLIGNKSINWQYSYKAVISTIGYKLRYLICKINIFIFNQSTINLIASNLTKSFLLTQIESNKLEILNITPIKRRNFARAIEKKNQFIFIIPSYDSSHKGLDFVLKLSKHIPHNYKILIVGNKLSEKQLARGKQSNIINLDQIGPEKLNRLYKESKITLVPSFYNEAFGRIIIESLVNKTPVISSPNCGANSFFIEKDFLKVVPLKLSLWLEAINDTTRRSHKITENDLKDIYNQFSIEQSIEDILKVIKQILMKRNELSVHKT